LNSFSIASWFCNLAKTSAETLSCYTTLLVKKVNCHRQFIFTIDKRNKCCMCCPNFFQYFYETTCKKFNYVSTMNINNFAMPETACMLFFFKSYFKVKIMFFSKVIEYSFWKKNNNNNTDILRKIMLWKVLLILLHGYLFSESGHLV
jgi:hypothetical protein